MLYAYLSIALYWLVMKKKYAAYAAVIAVVVIAVVIARNNLAGGAKKAVTVSSQSSSQVSVKTIKAEVYPVSPDLSYSSLLLVCPAWAQSNG